MTGQWTLVFDKHSNLIVLLFFQAWFFFLVRVGNTIEQVTRGQDDKLRVNKTSYSILQIIMIQLVNNAMIQR